MESKKNVKTLDFKKKTKVDALEDDLKSLFPSRVSVAELFRQQEGSISAHDFADNVYSFLPKAKVERVTDLSVLVTFPNGKTLLFAVQNNGSIVVLTKSDMKRRKITSKAHLNDVLRHFGEQHECCSRCAHFYDESESKTVRTHEFKCSSGHSKKHNDLCKICAELAIAGFHGQLHQNRCVCCEKLLWDYELINRSDPRRAGLCFLPDQLCVTLGYNTVTEIPNYICLRCSTDPKNF